MQLIEKQKKEKKNRLEMWCECCEGKFDRWDIDMVQPTEDFWLNDGEFSFACPKCVTEKNLLPLQTKDAQNFRYRNEILRREFSPIPCH